MSENNHEIVKGDKKVMNAWAFYDWANSVYPLVITTAIFPLFYEKLTTTTIGGVESDKVMFFGMEVINTALITIISAFYFLFIVVMMPILTGIADASGNKKTFMRFFAYLGSFSCMSLAFFNKDHLELSVLSYIFAGIGFWSSLVFYNSYLPDIAEEKDHDKLSAKGFSLGYIGSAILLVICLILVMTAPDEQKGFMSRMCFVLTGIWWFGFSHVTFSKLPHRKSELQFNKSIFKNGFLEIKKVFHQVRTIPALKKYLSSFFVYSMAVQTIMLVATYFGSKEINWPDKDASTQGLIISVLLIQLIAIPGAIGLSRLSGKIGNIKALGVVLVLWIGICFSAFVVTEPIHFYIIAGCVGLVMGGIQSLSRSTFSKLIPVGTKDTASFFSFYDISEKLGIVIGMLSYGFIEQLTGSMRNSIVALVIFFIIGLLLLFRVPKEEINDYDLLDSID
jgi:UMF1 family MFS transporter